MNPDYKEMLSALCGAEAQFIVVGAYALAAYGSTRATEDIDIWIRADAQNAAKVNAALIAFGAPAGLASPEDLATPDTVIQIGVRPRRIDILTTLSGLEFDEAWADRREVPIQGMSIPVLSRQHLIRNKGATGRPKDLLDIEWLERFGSDGPPSAEDRS